MEDKGLITRVVTWVWRDAPVWIVLASILFLIVVNLRRSGLMP